MSSLERDPRVYLAIERTYLAWTRTAIALMAFGFVIARLAIMVAEVFDLRPGGASGLDAGQSDQVLWLGTGLVIVGVLVQAVALIEHHQKVGRFRRGEDVVPARSWFSPAVGAALMLIGIGIAGYLVHLAG